MNATPSSCDLYINGKVEEAWNSISYNDPKEGSVHQSGNNRKTGYGVGKVQEVCTINLQYAAIKRLMDRAKSSTGVADVSKLPVQTLTLHITEPDGKLRTDVVLLKLLGNGIDVAGGTDALSVEIPNICLGIQYDV
jgi:hypothetical protein